MEKYFSFARQFGSALFVVTSLTSLAPAETITTNSLLKEMVSFDSLFIKSNPEFRSYLASSYDRRSVSQEIDTWFANDDFGNFISKAKMADRMEYTLLDATGPGAVTRIWSANPMGTIRFYFDGSSRPQLSYLFKDLLAAKTPAPFAYESGKGFNFYFPLPYSKSLKITVDDTGDSNPERLYFQVNYRQYENGAKVETYSRRKIDLKIQKEVSDALTGKSRIPNDGYEIKASPLGRNKYARVIVGGDNIPGVVRTLSLKLNRTSSSVSWDEILRRTLLEVITDGAETVRVPVGDFFGTAPGLNPHQGFAFQVEPSGWLHCQFPMPYRKSLVLKLTNNTSQNLTFDCTVKVGSLAVKTPYALHAQFLSESGSSKPARDLIFANLRGEGRYVGSNIVIGNSSSAWWGEGDEKIFVDGERTPSLFGTGTEDFFGFAWGATETFHAPYHAQTHVSGLPQNRGIFAAQRTHMLDSIPFSRGFKFNMELWHWEKAPIRYDRTVYWYGIPGQNPPAPVDIAGVGIKPIQ